MKKKSVIYILLSYIIIQFISSGLAALPDKKILIMYPSQRGLPWYENLHEIFRDEFSNTPVFKVNADYEYLDLMRNQGIEYRRSLSKLMHNRYSGKKYDLIITMNESLDFLCNEGKSLFPGVPVIFSTSRHYLEKTEVLRDNITGIIHDEKQSLVLGTLDTALRLFPGTKRVVIISGVDETSRLRESEARIAYTTYENRVSFTWLSGKPMDEIIPFIRNLNDDAIVIYFFMVTDGDNKTFIPAEAGRIIAQNSSRPVFGIIDTLMGSGVTGGYMNSSIPQGKGLVTLALRVLNGEQPADIPVGSYDYAYLFDWRKLKKYGVHKESLPPGAILLYKEPDFWEIYKWHIFAVVSLCAIETLLIIALIGNIIKRRGAEAELKQSNTILEIRVDERTSALSEINKKLEIEIQERIKVELVQKELIEKLQNALEEIKTLQGILPICSSCKKIRNDEGYWEQIESYFKNHIGTEFSHGLCPDCIKKLYPQIQTQKRIQP